MVFHPYPQNLTDRNTYSATSFAPISPAVEDNAEATEQKAVFVDSEDPSGNLLQQTQTALTPDN